MIQVIQEPLQTQKTVAGVKASQGTKSKKLKLLGHDESWWVTHTSRYNQLHGTKISVSAMVTPLRIATDNMQIVYLYTGSELHDALTIESFWLSRPDLDELLC